MPAAEAVAEDLYDVIAGDRAALAEASPERAAAGKRAPVVKRADPAAAPAENPPAGDLFDLLNEVPEPAPVATAAAAAEELPPARGDAADAPHARKGLPERKPPSLASILAASVAIAPKAQEIDGEATSTALPRDLAAERFGDYRLAALGGNERVRFAMPPCTWASPAMRHGPLYFEQPNLERYGTHRGGQWEASAEAAASFFAKTLLLPYQLADRPPRCTESTLGVYRPGGCTPHFFHLHGPSTRGAVAETLAVMGLVLLFP